MSKTWFLTSLKLYSYFRPSVLAEWFAPLMVTNEPNGEAILTGPIRDQAELFGVLLKLYNLNFTLLAVQPMAVSQ